MKYYQQASAQEPIMSPDYMTVIGFNLSVKLLAGKHTVNHQVRYDMDQADWFPIGELAQRIEQNTGRGHTLLNTLADAEAKMDALVAGDE